MKKYISTFAAILLAVVAFSQKNNAMDRYFSNYAQSEDYTHITITGKMFELMTHIEAETEEEKEIKEALEGIEGIEIIGSDSTAIAKAQYKNALGKVGNDFESLMTVDDKNAKVEFYIDERNGVVRELLIIGMVDDGFGIVDIWGRIDLKSVRNLTEKMQVMGMDQFDGDKAEAARHINYYPNPMKVGTDGNMKVPDAMLGTTLKVSDLNGRVLSETTINAGQSKVPMANLAQGTYLVSIWDGNARLFNEKVVVTK